MSDFINYFRSFGRNINGAFHKGVGRAYKPPGNPQHNFTRDPPGYDEVFGRASHIARTQQRHVDVNQDACNVLVASRVYSASPQVAVPVSPADAEPRVNTKPYIYRAQDDTTIQSAPQSREGTPEPEMHHLVEAITARSGPQPRVVTPELELHHLEDAISAQSTPRARVDTPQQSSNRLRGLKIDLDGPLPARIVSNPEPRATVSRLPTAFRSTSLQERFATPCQSTSPRVTVHPNQSEYRSSASDAVESYSVQLGPLIISAPQSALRSSIPVVGNASSQQRAVTSPQTMSQSSIPVATRPASSQQRVSSAAQPPPSRQAFTTSARFPLMNEQGPALSEQVASIRQRHCHNVVPQELRNPVRSMPRVYGTPQENSLSGDLNALRLHHSSDRADRPSFATCMQATSRQDAQSNGTSSSTVAGNTSTSGLQNTPTNGADRSSTSHRHENNSGACSNTRSRRELAHAESIESLNVEMNSPPITEPVTNFSRPRRPEPSLSNFSPCQINNEYLAEAYMRQTRGQTLAQRFEAEPPRRDLPRSPGMYNLPTVNDEINHPIHPGDFHDDGYHPMDRDPDRRAERAPAPASSPTGGNLRQHRGSRGSRQRRADRHREALAREEALAKEKESKKRKRERERREKCIYKVL